MFLLLAATSGLVGAAEHEIGVPVFGSQKYTEYVPGDLPLVISSPHGGALKPDTVADRTYGVRAADANTQDLARRIAAEVKKATGKQTTLVISHLHRSKLDPNREIKEAAQGNSTAEKVWGEYHAFIEEALQATVKRHGIAFFIDLHGQNHPDIRVELGYLHDPNDYAKAVNELNSSEFIQTGSLALIKKLNPGLDYPSLLSGPESLGALLEKRGFPSTPSPRMPVPSVPYFKGGYTVATHVPSNPQVCGLQIEANRVRLRDTEEGRQRFAEALVNALEVYFPRFLKMGLDGKK
ncbi:hypothetical protein BGE01nite_05110 [Brevifollis gellanilyticus]|uniref:N-formylglutamate amidohydrolase n=1 Tax=Brevifollis gellanilyticus TaxID=748831 RepID=A0A512M3B0_9BACT|nr:hypothetical protein BGE01nite_05110 [Brevifollis gellanilyticus]